MDTYDKEHEVTENNTFNEIKEKDNPYTTKNWENGSHVPVG